MDALRQRLRARAGGDRPAGQARNPRGAATGQTLHPPLRAAPHGPARRERRPERMDAE